jgi:hypothetical protein
MELISSIEESWDEENRQSVGKEWNLIQCCLSDGTCNPVGGSYPLNRCILGGRHLLPPNDGYMAVLVMPQEVRDVNDALDRLDEPWFRERFTELFAVEYEGTGSDRRLDELQSIFSAIRRFYLAASRGHRAVLFTTDETLDAIYRA